MPAATKNSRPITPSEKSDAEGTIAYERMTCSSGIAKANAPSGNGVSATNASSVVGMRIDGKGHPDAATSSVISVAARTATAPLRKPAPVMLTLRTHAGRKSPIRNLPAKATFNETKGEGISWAAWSWNPSPDAFTAANTATPAASQPWSDAGPAPGLHPAVPSRAADAPQEYDRPGRAPGRPRLQSRVRLLDGRPLRPVGAGRLDQPGTRINAGQPAMAVHPADEVPARYVGLDIPRTHGSVRRSTSRSGSGSRRTPFAR